MKQAPLLRLVAITVGLCLTAGLPLCWRLRQIWFAESYDGIEAQPLALWLPIALIAASATYVVIVSSLAPHKQFLGISMLLFSMAGFLAVLHPIFNELGSAISQVITPFVIELMSLGFLLGAARLLQFRLVKIGSQSEYCAEHPWRYAVSDLIMLSTSLAVFLAMVQQYDFFWHSGTTSRFQIFLWLKGFCLCCSSLAVTWASLSNSWKKWACFAICLAPLGVLPGWYAERSLLLPPYWYGIFTALHAGILWLLLLLLRINQYQIRRFTDATDQSLVTARAAEA